MRFDKEYSREEWTKYLGDNFKYEYGSIPNQNRIMKNIIIVWMIQIKKRFYSIEN